MFLLANINSLASNKACSEIGTWTAIWSPSKSALNGVHTNGCNLIAFPLTKTGSKAWIDKRCNVGARFNKTNLPLIASATYGQITGSWSSIIFLACLTVVASFLAIKSWIIQGSNNFAAISRGIPHWYILSSGPTTITERPE